MSTHASKGSPSLLLLPTELEARRFVDLGGLEPGFALAHLCGFGPVAAAARTAQLCGTLRPARVLLVGIAGTYDPEVAPTGEAIVFTRVALEGVGVGEGESFQGPPALGFPQWPGSEDTPLIQETLPLASPVGTDPALLLTTCAASASPDHARQRRRRFADARAEDMEGFGVALACALFNVPLAIVRGISNVVGDRSPENWRIPGALAAARRAAAGVLDSPLGMKRLRVGISTCPNDTFTFHPLMGGAVACQGVDELDFELLDVEELNRRMLRGDFDVCKVSFHAALTMAERILVLPVGAALGFGVGPLLLRAAGRGSPAGHAQDGALPRVLCPGEWTTAHLLWKLFHPEPARVEQVVFSEIMPALAAGRADYGICIHEGRFTWEEAGLGLVEDLGTTWEEATGAALPLGGIVCRRDLGPALVARVAEAVTRSLEHARAAPQACLPTMRRHAQELADEVLWKHVELYVNEHTHALGDVGRRALDELSRLAGDRGLVAAGARLEIA